ncbi:hypothetical protein F7725_022354 [Dissostichus mawsoni]|uniref:Uncharacterized protein n=1 Tax=Dissostichus mawsoni TaxID=36200 RepID=A0A7J5YZT0_DISMA|nr:hypothetical protein F7725_022354 [Dissostichus mawsoni]
MCRPVHRCWGLRPLPVALSTAGPPVTAPAAETPVMEPQVSRQGSQLTMSRCPGDHKNSYWDTNLFKAHRQPGTHSITHTDTQVTQEADSEHTAARVAESVLEDVVMDEDLLRLPVKRKNKEVSKGSVAQKGKVSKTESLCSSSQPEGVTEDSEGSDSESFFDIVEVEKERKFFPEDQILSGGN